MERRFLLGLGAILIMCMAVVIALVLRLLLFALTPPQGPPDTNINVDFQGTVVPTVGFIVSLPVISYLLWDSSNHTWRRGVLYMVVVLVIGALSYANYISFDSLAPLWFQAILNVVLAFAASMSIILLWYVEFKTAEARVFKYAAIFGLGAFGVLAPLLFSLIYLGARLHFASKNQEILVFSNNAVALACAVGGLILALLKYRDDHRAKSVTLHQLGGAD
jgi:hypothetical protein